MNHGDPAAAMRIKQILWATLLAAQVIYVGVILSGVVAHDESFDVPALPVALAIVALGTGIGARWSFRRATGADLPAHVPPPEPAASFPFFIVTWALDESIAIYGLVLAVLGFPETVWAGFSAAGFILMLFHRPS